MKAGGAFRPIVRVTNASGAAVTGLAGGTFTVTGYLNGATTSLTVTWTEIGSGLYSPNITLPATAGWFTVTITNGSNVVFPNRWEGANTAQDADSVYGVVNKPVSYITATTGVPGIDTPLTLDANRQATITVSVVNSSGTAIDLSGFNNWRMTVWDKTHSSVGTRTIISTGITGSAGGVLTIAIPETAGFFSLMDAAITAGNDTLQLYYDVVADAAANATNSQNIIRGLLTLRRYEGAA